MSIMAKIMSAMARAFRITFEVVRAIVNGMLEIRYRANVEQEDAPREQQMSPEEAAMEQNRAASASRDASIIKRFSSSVIDGKPSPSDMSQISSRGRIWLKSLTPHELHIISESPVADLRDHLRRKRVIDGVRPIPAVVDAMTHDGAIPPSAVSAAEHALIDAEISEGIRNGTIVSPREREEREALIDVIKDRDAFANRIRAKQGLAPEPRGKQKLN